MDKPIAKPKTGKVRHVINCDADPYVPKNWSVEKHRKGGELRWDPKKVALYLSENQKGREIQGHELCKELRKQPVLNACVLDYLLAHTKLIPSAWKGKYIYFWGTIYRGSDGDLLVRCLHWFGKRWGWLYFWLVGDFSAVGPAAVSASRGE